MFNTIQEVMALSRQNGYTFFDKERQRATETTVHPTIYYGRYFITEGTYHGRRLFSIHRALRDGACDIVQGEVFLSHRQAKRYISMFLEEEEEQPSEEYFNG